MNLARAFQVATDLAARARSAYGPELQELCYSVERVLAELLEREPAWSSYDWLDGFVPSSVEREPGRVVVRGGAWVNANRIEPCEVEVRLLAPSNPAPVATIRFMSAAGPSGAKRPERLKFPIRDWVYVFDVT
jgi:hypothetical protein